MRFRKWQVLLLFALSGFAMCQAHSIRLDDNSDWWSWIKQDLLPEGVKSQGREPADTNFQIAGLTLDSDFEQIASRFGQASVVGRGDAATGRHQVCYVSYSGNVHLIFEFGEVDSVIYLFEGGPNWNGSELCAVSRFVTVEMATTSGLRLGMSAKQLKVILGEPNVATPGKVIYYFEFKKKTSPQGLAQLRKDNPNMSDEEFSKNFEWLDVTAYMEARLVRGRLNYLAISRSEVY